MAEPEEVEAVEEESEQGFGRGFFAAMALFALVQILAVLVNESEEPGGTDAFISAYSVVCIIGWVGILIAMVIGLAVSTVGQDEDMGFAKGWFAGSSLSLLATFALCAAFA